jgi:hypothetical protein
MVYNTLEKKALAGELTSSSIWHANCLYKYRPQVAAALKTALFVATGASAIASEIQTFVSKRRNQKFSAIRRLEWLPHSSLGGS